MPTPTVIKVENVEKTFKLPHEKTSSMKSLLINFRKRRTYEKQEALRNISFEVKKGEFFGIVGRNGSGKSTLLKLLAGIYSPTNGLVSVHGTLTPFIELGVGFSPELTGKENVYLNGALLGFNRKQMSEMYNDIVNFAELKEFMDQKLKNYSSGMQVRLAFSIAIRAKSDILLIDEVLAVGDERFQAKCLRIFHELKAEGRTIVFISHDMESIKKFCDRAVVIHKGLIKYEGTPAEATREYVRLNFPEASVDTKKPKDDSKAQVIALKGEKRLRNNASINYGDKVKFNIKWHKNSRIKNVGVALYSDSGQYIFGTNTILEKKKLVTNKISYEVELNLGRGNYYIQVGLFGETDSEKIYFIDRAYEFIVQAEDRWQGLTQFNHRWEL